MRRRGDQHEPADVVALQDRADGLRPARASSATRESCTMRSAGTPALTSASRSISLSGFSRCPAVGMPPDTITSRAPMSLVDPARFERAHQASRRQHARRTAPLWLNVFAPPPSTTTASAPLRRLPALKRRQAARDAHARAGRRQSASPAASTRRRSRPAAAAARARPGRRHSHAATTTRTQHHDERRTMRAELFEEIDDHEMAKSTI